MAGTMSCVAILSALAVVAVFAAPQWKSRAIATIVAVIVLRYRRFLYVVIVTLPRDITFVKLFLCFMMKMTRMKKDNATVVSMFTARATREPERTCFMFEDRTWTNRQVNEYSNQVAQVFHNAGFRHGDIIALCMDNRPEHACIWLGLAKLGVVTALINHNLRLQQLIHTLQVAKVKGVIYCEHTSSAIEEISGSLDPSTKLYHLEKFSPARPRVTSLQPLLDAAPKLPPRTDRQPSMSDELMYIYTSGTTGLPKAAIIPHSRYLLITAAAVEVYCVHADDVVYNPLPLYHTSGGNIGVGLALVQGIPVAIARKFSASSYWKDCIKYNCTIGQYIGEICRYLLAVPPTPEERQHRIRLMLGNGIRASIWPKFVERFNIPRIAEVYGSTEGNARLVNIDGRIGAVGFIPRLVPWSLVGMALIRVDQTTGEPRRGRDGLCVLCDIGEPGMLVATISSRNETREFHGYVDEKASAQKVVFDVFKRGDKAYLTGDILVMDEYGYIYFKDRTGDTFRWKGENVSTAEVESVIIDIIGLGRDFMVYGVEVPGREGRAGMLAVVDVNSSLDLDALATGLDKMLASFARPMFLRVVTHMDITGTYKLKKGTLRTEGFDPSTIKDKLYVRHGAKFLPLTQDYFKDIVAGRVRM